MENLLAINNLNIFFKQDSIEDHVLKDVTFSLKNNEILGVVGESGSGKSVMALAILGLLSNNAKVTGEIFFNDINLLTLTPKEIRPFRGNKIAMIFQEPMSSLNPSLTCGYQVLEVILLHQKIKKNKAKEKVIALFNEVKLPRAEVIYNQYPHQLSGGQKQRIMIAMAIACEPQLLIADEPTTALDVTVQKEIISLLKELQETNQMSVIFISHDLELVSEIANNVLVLQQGKIIEQGETEDIFKRPKENYTKALLASKPSLKGRLKRLPTIEDFLNNDFKKEETSKDERQQLQQEIYSKAPILEIKNVKKYFKTDKGFLKRDQQIVKAVDDVTFNLYEGETLGLVGESGCGKTTLGRTILQLDKVTSGEIFYNKKDITKLSNKEIKLLRKEIQIIFQDPFSSLNPRIPVGLAILEPMKVHNILQNNQQRKEYVFEILERVGLEREHFNRYPHEFSGGQRQRIGIARAIALKPKLVICDESVSALDVSIQAQVLNLLNDLKTDFGFTYIFISHDLAVVKHMSDQLVVMNQGKIEEIGDADIIYNNPKSDYTKNLIDAIPKGI